MREISVTEYSKEIGITRQGVLLQITENRLPKNVEAKKVGNVYVLKIEKSKNKIAFSKL